MLTKIIIYKTVCLCVLIFLTSRTDPMQAGRFKFNFFLSLEIDSCVLSNICRTFTAHSLQMLFCVDTLKQSQRFKSLHIKDKQLYAISYLLMPCCYLATGVNSGWFDDATCTSVNTNQWEQREQAISGSDQASEPSVKAPKIHSTSGFQYSICSAI